MDKALMGAAVCVSGYIALEAICRAFYKYATEEHIWIPIVVMMAVTVICAGVAVKCFKWE